MLLHQIDDLLMLQVARGGHHHIGRRVVALHVAGQHATRHTLDAVLAAQHGTPERLRRERRLLEIVEDDVIRRVVGLADLLQDHAALALQLLRLEGGVRQDVADDVGTQRGVLLQQLDVVRRLLTRGVGVDVAAHRLDLLGDLRRGAAFGALERHMLQEVRDAVLVRGLVAGAGGDVGAEGDGLHPVHAFGDDGQAGWQAGELDGIGHWRGYPETRVQLVHIGRLMPRRQPLLSVRVSRHRRRLTSRASLAPWRRWRRAPPAV